MTGCPIKRIITFKEAVVYGPVKVIDNFDKNITKECRFSWSTDGVCWTSWVSWIQYNTLAKNLESDYFLRILIFISRKYITILIMCLQTVIVFVLIRAIYS